MAGLFTNVLKDLHIMEQTTTLENYSGVLAASDEEISNLDSTLEDLISYLPDFIGIIGELQKVALENTEEGRLDSRTIQLTGWLITELSSFLGIAIHHQQTIESDRNLKKRINKAT